MRFRIVGCALLLACLSACQPEATPFPVDIPTPATATPIPGNPAALRYALAPNTVGSVADLGLLESRAEVIQFNEPINPDEIGTQFDLIAAYGSYADASPSPIQVTVSIILNTTLAPLDDPVLANVLQRSLDTSALAAFINIPGIQAVPHDSPPTAALRAELANAGWPDGLDFSLAYENVIALNALQALWQALHSQINPFPLQNLRGETHLILFAWSTPDQRTAFTEQFSGVAIDLLTVPISYWAAPGLQIDYSPQGWPLPTRP
jgi:hypothetical protein